MVTPVQGSESKSQSQAQSQSPAQSQDQARGARSQGSQQSAPSIRTESARTSGVETSVTPQATMQTGVDILKSSALTAVDSIVREIEPQLTEFATTFGHQALERGTAIGKTAIARAQRQSWGRIALAAGLFAGAVALLAYEAGEASSKDSVH